MMDFSGLLLMLGLAAFFAGMVDAIVGGGGLIQIPALFSSYPSQSPAILLGTNKISSIVGTTSAAFQYARRVAIPWRIAVPGAIAALAGAWVGAQTVVYLPGGILRPIVLLLLILVAIYTFLRKDFGAVSKDQESNRAEVLISVLIGAAVGFYDGFFGPGTGSFLIFLFVRFVGLDFLRASATAKILNVATNFAALSFFSMSVALLWKVGLVMAACNLCGSLIGSGLAIRHGSGFVRKIFLVVVLMMIVKMSYDLLVA